MFCQKEYDLHVIGCGIRFHTDIVSNKFVRVQLPDKGPKRKLLVDAFYYNLDKGLNLNNSVIQSRKIKLKSNK